MTTTEDGGLMHHRCFDDQELAELVSLEADAPRRREAAACPRCDSLVRACETFLAGDPELPMAERQRAEQHLSTFVANRLATAATDGGRGPRQRATVRNISGRRWAMGTFLAAATVATFILTAPTQHGTDRPSGAMRGGSAATDPTGLEGFVITRQPGTADDLHLAWPHVPTADRYEVLLLSATLDTLAVIEDLTEASATFPGGLLDVDGGFCRVRALAAGRTVSTSPLQAVARPRSGN